jgi:hypothetical protein
MKMPVATVLMVSACAVGVFAQTSMQKTPAPPAQEMAMDKAAIEKALIANETKINVAVEKHDAAGFNAIVASDGWTVDPMGPSPASDFAKMLPKIQVEPGWKITDTKVLWIDDNTAVLTYKWTGKGTMDGQPFPSPTWASTVYTKRGAKWTAVFHQETESAPPPKK